MESNKNTLQFFFLKNDFQSFHCWEILVSPGKKITKCVHHLFVPMGMDGNFCISEQNMLFSFLYDRNHPIHLVELKPDFSTHYLLLIQTIQIIGSLISFPSTSHHRGGLDVCSVHILSHLPCHDNYLRSDCKSAGKGLKSSLQNQDFSTWRDFLRTPFTVP